MNIEQATQISLVDFLTRLGHHPVKVKGKRHWYNSPYRNERTPSFNVDTDINQWYDFGAGEGGGIILLAKRIYQTDSTSEVLRRIRDFGRIPVNRHNKPPGKAATSEPIWKNITTKSITSYALMDYLRRRGIPLHIGMRYCREIGYELRGKRYFALGFLNDSGGYELRNPYFKGCMGKKDITILRHTIGRILCQSSCHIFEGFFDFLSYLVLIELGILPRLEDSQDEFIILNSVANIGKIVRVLDGYDRVYTYLDNDAAGKAATDTIVGMCGNRVRDMSFLYAHYSDLNDFLVSYMGNYEGKDNSQDTGRISCP